MDKNTKALLSLAGCVILGTVIANALQLDDNSCTFGFMLGVISNIVYSYVKE